MDLEHVHCLESALWEPLFYDRQPTGYSGRKQAPNYCTFIEWWWSCFVLFLKDTIEEDVDQKRKASLQRMPSLGAAEEVNEENDGYDYDDDFEVGYSCMSYEA